MISCGADAVLDAARGVHDDVVARLQCQLAGVKEIGFCVVAEAHVHDRGRLHRVLRRGVRRKLDRLLRDVLVRLYTCAAAGTCGRVLPAAARADLRAAAALRRLRRFGNGLRRVLFAGILGIFVHVLLLSAAVRAA